MPADGGGGGGGCVTLLGITGRKADDGDGLSRGTDDVAGGEAKEDEAVGEDWRLVSRESGR